MEYNWKDPWIGMAKKHTLLYHKAQTTRIFPNKNRKYKRKNKCTNQQIQKQKSGIFRKISWL